MVSLTVMAATMTVLLKATSGQQDQARYNRTVDRYNTIKEAILNVSNVNGVPMVGGFVADMGRLPRKIHELLERQWCPSNFADPICSGNLKLLPAWSLYSICADGSTPTGSPLVCANNALLWVTLGGGWRGPYVQTSQNPIHTDNAGCADAFADGWGNVECGESYPDKRHNYGWYFNDNTIASFNPAIDNPQCGTGVTSNPGCLTIYSYGNGCYKDDTICKGSLDAQGNSLPDTMDFSFPPPALMTYDATTKYANLPNDLTVTPNHLLPAPMFKPTDWQAIIGGANNFTSVQVLMMPNVCTSITTPACTNLPHPVCLNLYHVVDGVIEVDSFVGNIVDNGLAKSVPFSPANGGSVSIPLGNAAISIHEAVNPSLICNTANGTNTPTYPVAGRQAVPVKILPGQIPSFVW